MAVKRSLSRPHHVSSKKHQGGPLEASQRSTVLGFVDKICEEFESDSLDRVSFDRLKELPDSPGVYIAVGPEGQVFYVGKANCLRSRCSLSSHDGLEASLSLGACTLLFAEVDDGFHWHVEQVLISRLHPSVNKAPAVSWWDSRPASKTVPLRPSRNQEVWDTLRRHHPQLSDLSDSAFSDYLDMKLLDLLVVQGTR